MKGIYINSGIVWNAYWSHSHELTKALAQKNKVYYFENIRIKARPNSGLYEANKYPVPENVEIIRSPKIFEKIGFFYPIYNQLFSLKSLWLKRRKIDFFLSYNIYDLPTFLLAKLLKKKTVFLFIDEYDILTRWPKFTPILRFSLKKHLKHSDKIVCTAQKLFNRAKKYNKNVYYLPNAVNLNNLEIIKKVKIEEKTRPRIGFIGHLGHWIDVDLIIRAAKKYPQIDFEIVGSGELMPKLTKTQKELKNLILLGEVKHSEVFQRSVNFDLAIIPFLLNEITQSVSPIKLFEYWLAKRPVIAKKTMELEQFKDYLLLYENEKQFFDYLDKFAKKPNIYAKLGEKGFNLVQKKYNWQRYEEIFNNQILI